MNNIFKNLNYPIIRFIQDNKYINIIKTHKLGYIIILYNSSTNFIYKIPTGSSNSPYNGVYICTSTLYSSILIFAYADTKLLKVTTDNKFAIYKPIYFERFKYVGKGFKLVFKRKKKFFNCVFGHSHIYWIKLKTILTKKTKKYKYIFIARSYNIFLTMVYILQKIKPINRYTLRGVRTYTHPWIKRKGRKSIATHI